MAGGSALAPPLPGDAVNRHEKQGSGRSDNQRFPVIFLYRGRQDCRPSTGIDPEGTTDDDRGHFNRLRLPARYPVRGGGGFFADPRRLWAAGIDDRGLVPGQVDQQPRKGVYHHSGPAAIAPSIGVLAATA